jgi:hypothetical protein
MSIQECSDNEMIFICLGTLSLGLFYMFGNPDYWIRTVVPFLFYFLDLVYFFIKGIGVNDFAVKDCTTCCLVNSFKFSIPLHFLTLLGIDPPHFAIKAAA